VETEISLIGIIRGAWLLVCRLWFSQNHSWPIRVKILKSPIATFLYPQRRCRIEITAEFHLRIKPVVLKDVQLEIKGEDSKQTAMSFYLRTDYQQLKHTSRREEEFIFEDFAEGREGRLIINADDSQCQSKWFSIKLTNKKDDLPPLDSFEGQERIIKL